MDYYAVIVFFVLKLLTFAQSAPRLRVLEDQVPPNLLTLPSNATSIRANIEDSFSCEGRQYGYYADVENDCQLFHVCLPVAYSNGRSQMFRWSFICPDETVFNQEIFTCTRADEAIECADSPKFYNLNRNFGDVNEEPEEISTEKDSKKDERESTVTIFESSEVPQVTHENTKSPPIVPIYNRRIMKL